MVLIVLDNADTVDPEVAYLGTRDELNDIADSVRKKAVQFRIGIERVLDHERADCVSCGCETRLRPYSLEIHMVHVWLYIPFVYSGGS